VVDAVELFQVNFLPVGHLDDFPQLLIEDSVMLSILPLLLVFAPDQGREAVRNLMQQDIQRILEPHVEFYLIGSNVLIPHLPLLDYLGALNAVVEGEPMVLADHLLVDGYERDCSQLRIGRLDLLVGRFDAHNNIIL
jgi:hypothetical protein